MTAPKKKKFQSVSVRDTQKVTCPTSLYITEETKVQERKITRSTTP